MTNVAIPLNRKGLQGAADVRHRACSSTVVRQVPGNTADAVPCEHLRFF